jgi:hypothetical protein
MMTKCFCDICGSEIIEDAGVALKGKLNMEWRESASEEVERLLFVDLCPVCAKAIASSIKGD